jgi:hypothetical protein
MNREGIATTDENIWPQVPDKILSKVKLRLSTRNPQFNLTSKFIVAGKELDVHLLHLEIGVDTQD